jgi:uncharacterized protein DUF6516
MSCTDGSRRQVADPPERPRASSTAAMHALRQHREVRSWRFTPLRSYGILCHMRAVLAFHDKQVLPDGAIVEMKIWRVPMPVPGSAHGLKYRLFYGVPGTRLIAYDNERDKGDHRHFQGKEERYIFETVEQLVADFLADVRRLRGDT